VRLLLAGKRSMSKLLEIGDPSDGS